MIEEPIDSNEELEDNSQHQDEISSVSLECRWKAEQEYGKLYHSVVEWKENSYYD